MVWTANSYTACGTYFSRFIPGSCSIIQTSVGSSAGGKCSFIGASSWSTTYNAGYYGVGQLHAIIASGNSTTRGCTIQSFVAASNGGSIRGWASQAAVIASSNSNNYGFATLVAAEVNHTEFSSCTFRTKNLSKASGTFAIDHPDPAKNSHMILKHSFVEAPTAGENIYRYKVTTLSGSATIELPSYYKYLNTNDQVFVTPQDHFGAGYGSVNEEQTQVDVSSNLDGDYNVLVIGTRKDWDALHAWNGVEEYKK